MRRITRSWDKAYEHEAIFSCFHWPLFQLMSLYVMFSCPCDIKRFATIIWNGYLALNYERAWRNNFHTDTVKFQGFSWNFSFHAVKRKWKILFTFSVNNFSKSLHRILKLSNLCRHEHKIIILKYVCTTKSNWSLANKLFIKYFSLQLLIITVLGVLTWLKRNKTVVS